MQDRHYDVVIVGSGPGGGTMAWRLAQTGKRVLLLERGDYLQREPANWNSQIVFNDARYQATETWYGADGSSFHPGLHYFVGGNSKMYGAVLLRLRERDFGEIVHPDGVSPAWPIGYDAFEPYYQQAEALYHVHGLRGEDPTEPWSSGPYAYPPIKNEPRIQQLFDDLDPRGPSSVPPAGRRAARRGRRRADADVAVHQVRGVRRLSVSPRTARPTRR